MKFSLLKAFYIVYYVSNSKKGISSTELSRRLGLRQKTCWYFKQKVMSALKSSGDHPLKGRVEVDETAIGGQEEGVRGRKNESKKLIVVAIEHVDKGISRMYAKVIQHSSSKELGEFMKLHIDSDAVVKTDRIYTIEKGFPKTCASKIQEQRKQLANNHHKVDREYLQFYLNEFCFATSLIDDGLRSSF